MKLETVEWLKQAEYDLETAWAMWKTSRYLYVVFMCHLAVEKALKAIIIERTGDAPPRTHNLIELAKLGNVNLDEKQKEFISILNSAAVGARYPDFLDNALKKYSRKKTLEYLHKAREVIQWLKKEVQ